MTSDWLSKFCLTPSHSPLVLLCITKSSTWLCSPRHSDRFPCNAGVLFVFLKALQDTVLHWFSCPRSESQCFHFWSLQIRLTPLFGPGKLLRALTRGVNWSGLLCLWSAWKFQVFLVASGCSVFLPHPHPTAAGHPSFICFSSRLFRKMPCVN